MVSNTISVRSQETVDFVEYDLKNGLHVILHKDNENPIVSVVSRRFQRRRFEPNRLCSPVRTHDVSGFKKRRKIGTLHVHSKSRWYT